jgi:transcriptional regulator with XRE-family HTH domain
MKKGSAMLQNPVGEIIKKLRRKNAWSQEHFASISGIATRTLQRIENGEKANTETLRAIAAVLKIDVTDLLPLNEPMDAEVFAKAEAQNREQAARLEKELNTLPRVHDGKELLDVVSSFHVLKTDYPTPKSLEEGAVMAALLENVRDYGDLHGETSPMQEMEMVIEVERQLEELAQYGLKVFAGKLNGLVIVAPPDKDVKPARLTCGAVFICRENEINTFNDPGNGMKESARFHLPGSDQM